PRHASLARNSASAAPPQSLLARSHLPPPAPQPPPSGSFADHLVAAFAGPGEGHRVGAGIFERHLRPAVANDPWPGLEWRGEAEALAGEGPAALHALGLAVGTRVVGERSEQTHGLVFSLHLDA